MCRRGNARHVSRVAETDAQVKTQFGDIEQAPGDAAARGEKTSSPARIRLEKNPSPTRSQDEVDG